ncbi:magnesium and cobalt transport protein CorA [Paucibacter sp. PLA-PC-4]|uniref:magnesium and cobalt transport protein CorA n=1 Tax=Paucibacter sp. PLA-PC-4 TaxID=2993655 RepID=UPI00224A7201|nr:magnesium and cobalt transport protein CorA [Paucibacter sp. PLA-PC-4]MCX2865516.1 magnesium and cobalt transport protein CorA [Paucibacter sp. PLA-PC-4]
MLINCAAYREGHKVADLAPEELGAYLDQPDTFVWVALRDSDAAELESYRRLFNLHSLAIEDASHGHQRPKVEEYGDDLFVVMHLIDWVGGELQLGEVMVFVGRNHVLSVRKGSKLHFLGVRERCEREPQLLRQGPSFVLYALMDAVVDRYFPIVDLLESELEEIEQSIFTSGAARDNIQRLYALKRRLMLLRRAVAPMLEMLSKLHGGRTPPICAKSEEYFRDVADHLARIHGAIESVRETIGTAIQANLSMVAIEDSDVTKRLAAWAGIFAAATAFAGIWGMNFEWMPELKWQWGYPAALGLITTVCVGLWYRFKRAGWL